MSTLSNKTVVITGASRGIGLAIAERVAADGANVAVLAKTDEPHPQLPGTVHTAVEAVEAAGGHGLAVVCDIRDEQQVDDAVAHVVDHFGGIDVLVNNASAISLTDTQNTPIKRFDLMHQINQRGTFLVSQKCVEHLKHADNPHVLTLAPPLDIQSKWFEPHVAYSMAKYGMSLCVLGMAAEFADDGIAFNALWPRTGIATAAIDLIGGAEMRHACRKPTIVADAAHAILTRDSREFSGQFCLDDNVLFEAGVRDFDSYAVTPGATLWRDMFVPDDDKPPSDKG
ncbi:NAD(P)-dependent oxidoreductase [Salinisphaera sp. USBA-960]|uniref:SDR family oxidoreductase n=1 Tax=Salinisphaera orenii TaxID=856731 RepID=UPI000DBEA292|nr:NAD(P)-dependent oxidoreductase [Salifodinibacter halophilus]NNC26728.1 NAD(P)-dependent oxidoreductase [Salifodinibacter halophilus]